MDDDDFLLVEMEEADPDVERPMGLVVPYRCAAQAPGETGPDELQRLEMAWRHNRDGRPEVTFEESAELGDRG